MIRAAFLSLSLCAAITAQQSALAGRVGNTGFVQLTAESFNKLTPREQALAYWLSQASIAIDPIIYDQLSRFGLRQKRLLESIVAHPAGRAAAMHEEDRRFHQAVLGQQRQSQRDDRAEIPARVHVRGIQSRRGTEAAPPKWTR